MCSSMRKGIFYDRKCTITQVNLIIAEKFEIISVPNPARGVM